MIFPFGVSLGYYTLSIPTSEAGSSDFKEISLI